MKNHADSELKFSLVLATIHRVTEIDRFLASLSAQGVSENIELIIVDQNTDDRLLPLIQKYGSEFSITRVRSEPGLSKARNVGLRHVTGDIVAFPDDDCWYPSNLLMNVLQIFSEDLQIDGLTCKCIDERGMVSMARFDPASGLVNKYNVWRRAISFSIFLRKRAVAAIDGFDELLGVGSGTIYGAAEETDYLIRIVDSGFKVLYRADLAVGHPNTDSVQNNKLLQRTASYSPGVGYVMVKNNYPIWRMALALLKPALGATIALCFFNVKLYKVRLARLQGMLKGIVSKWNA